VSYVNHLNMREDESGEKVLQTVKDEEESKSEISFELEDSDHGTDISVPVFDQFKMIESPAQNFLIPPSSMNSDMYKKDIIITNRSFRQGERVKKILIVDD